MVHMHYSLRSTGLGNHEILAVLCIWKTYCVKNWSGQMDVAKLPQVTPISHLFLLPLLLTSSKIHLLSLLSSSHHPTHILSNNATQKHTSTYHQWWIFEPMYLFLHFCRSFLKEKWIKINLLLIGSNFQNKGNKFGYFIFLNKSPF